MDRRHRIVSWNCNGLPDKRQELLQFLTEFDVDVALIQETHLRPGINFTAPNYAVYRTDRPLPPGAQGAGGVAVLVHRRVPHRHIPRPAWTMELVSIALPYRGRELELSSLYCPPRTPPHLDELHRLLQPDQPAIIAGDLNAKHPDWGCRATTTGGRHLQRFLQNHPHVQVTAPITPTHFPAYQNHRPDILDIALHCDIEDAIAADAIIDLSSDHVPVMFTLDDPAEFRLPPGRRPRVNWAKYYQYLADRPRPAPTPATPRELDEQVSSLHAHLQEAVLHSLQPAPDRADHSRKLPQHLQREVQLRRLLRRRWQRTRCPWDKAAFNRQSLAVKRLLQEHSEGRWKDFLSTVNPEDGSIWRLARSLRKDKPVTRPLHGRAGLVYSPEDKAETFADSMEIQFTPHPDIYDDRHCDRVEEFLDNLDAEEEDSDEEDLPPITAEEVTTALRRLKPRKAAGPDGLATPALQKLPVWVVSTITSLYNSSLQLRHFPTPWKTAKLILIPKQNKDLTFPENYRPISLLPALSKILERLLLARFPEDFHASISEEQYGFRRGHSTTLQLTRVMTALVDTANMGLLTTAVSIDVSKAFDRVWHEGLLYKLAHSPLPRQTFDILKSYLTDRQFSVSVGPATSSVRPISAGVPQGSVLGPVLYLWYTNDIPVAPRVSAALYADDALFYVRSARVGLSCRYMQRQLDLLNPWLKKWRIKVNAAKCEAICFTRKQYSHVLREQLTLQGDRVPWKKQVRYLGVVLSRTLTTTPAAKKRLDIGRAAFNALQPLLKKSSPLSVTTKMLLYKAIIRPTVTYAAPAWYQLTPTTTRKKLESFQARCVRTLTATPWFVRNVVMLRSVGLQTIEETVRDQARRMFQDAASSEWRHISEWATNPGAPEFHYRRPRALIDDPP